METILLYLKGISKEDLKQLAKKDNRNVNSFILQAIKEKSEKISEDM